MSNTKFDNHTLLKNFVVLYIHVLRYDSKEHVLVYLTVPAKIIANSILTSIRVVWYTELELELNWKELNSNSIPNPMFGNWYN